MSEPSVGGGGSTPSTTQRQGCGRRGSGELAAHRPCLRSANRDALQSTTGSMSMSGRRRSSAMPVKHRAAFEGCKQATKQLAHLPHDPVAANQYVHPLLAPTRPPAINIL